MAKDPHDPGTLDLFGDTPAAGTAASQRGGTQMRRFSEMNAGRFIRAADYEPGERFLVIIVQVYEDELLGRGGDKELTLVLSLAHDPSRQAWGDYVPNLTARKVLARAYGDDPMVLIGQSITLVVVTTGFENRNGFIVIPGPRQQLRPEPPVANTRPRRITPRGNGDRPTAAVLPDDLDDPIDDLLPH